MRKRAEYSRRGFRNLVIAITACSAYCIGHPVGAQPEVVATNYARLHRDERPLLVFREKSQPDELHLGVMESATSSSRGGLTKLVTLNMTKAEYDRCDVWISGVERPLTCLLLREERFGNIVDHSIIPYRVVGADGTPDVFAAHRKELLQKAGEQTRTEVRTIPVKLRIVLRGKLEPGSPMRQSGLPEVNVKSVEQVRIEDDERGPAVRGILNGEWRFVLSLSIDGDAQRVVPGDLALEKISPQ